MYTVLCGGRDEILLTLSGVEIKWKQKVWLIKYSRLLRCYNYDEQYRLPSSKSPSQVRQDCRSLI